MASEASGVLLRPHRLTGHELRLRRLALEDVPRAAVIEAESYPADEAASAERMAERCREAGEHFWGVFASPVPQGDVASASFPGAALVGFINGTRAEGDTLTDESMEEHMPEGRSLCIHSVVVAEKYRRCGVARAALQAYMKTQAQDTRLDRMLLIAKGKLLTLYLGAGFKLVGPSSVVHGQDPWFELGLDMCLARQLDFVQVDAFTAVPFRGNPAAVVFTQRGGDEAWMQRIAVEFNLAETAFLEHASASDDHFNLRWFTPVAEVDLCGHATLAAAKAVWATRQSYSQALRFQTKSGELLVSSSEDGWLHMDFPAEPAQPLATAEAGSSEEGAPAGAVRLPASTPADLASAFGIPEASVLFVGQNRMDLLVHVTVEAFDLLQRNDTAIAAFPVRGVIVTAEASNRVPADAGAVDFVSRFFGPRFGINEDPVTGSAHCALAPFWASRLGNNQLVAWQASDRGGLLRVTNNAATSRVLISGQATVVMQGQLDP
uniref:N-acetyltransferase domain-containing protein n=1 Tax=Rhizochromulina marina TaxID=1034831 RepID=A0A7S2RT05_9STRA|mmetsp:Transcript_20628/g.60291  ORF Transcript_20628/g.60291 Transcript_20628/m.60291 type:complete len:492 (+) Transcript_20628:103-1578(+)